MNAANIAVGCCSKDNVTVELGGLTTLSDRLCIPEKASIWPVQIDDKDF